MNQPDKLANLLQNIPAGRLGRRTTSPASLPSGLTRRRVHHRDYTGGRWRPAMELQRAMTDIPPCQPFSHDTSAISRADTLTPAERYQELFVAVQMQRVFPDSKTFVDCAPRRHPEAILEDYRARCGEPGFDLEAFVHEHFSLYGCRSRRSSPTPTTAWPSISTGSGRSSPATLRTTQSTPRCCRCRTITWCRAGASPSCTTGIPISPCSAWTRAGIATCCGPWRTTAYLIDTYGHVPNGNRTYYLGRSQPPVFALMTELFEKPASTAPATTCRNCTRNTPSGWRVPTCCARARRIDAACVSGRWNGAQPLLGRARNAARGPTEDVETARSSCRPRHRSIATDAPVPESGWDFSSRWLDDAHRLATIRTTSILPVDLNALLYKLERQIAELSAVKNQHACAEAFARRAEARLAAIDQYLWNSALAPISTTTGSAPARDNLTAATLAPLFVRMASAERGRGGGGDGAGAPAGARRPGHHRNRWQRRAVGSAQWLGTAAVDRHSWAAARHDALALDIEELADYRQPPVRAREQAGGKYVLRPCTEHAGGARYPLQDGFGWTNGVTRKLMQEDPNHEANRCRAGIAGAWRPRRRPPARRGISTRMPWINSYRTTAGL